MPERSLTVSAAPQRTGCTEFQRMKGRGTASKYLPQVSAGTWIEAAVSWSSVRGCYESLRVSRRAHERIVGGSMHSGGRCVLPCWSNETERVSMGQGRRHAGVHGAAGSVPRHRHEGCRPDGRPLLKFGYRKTRAPMRCASPCASASASTHGGPRGRSVFPSVLRRRPIIDS